MANVAVQEDVDVTAPSLIEGFPGVGLVGKIAADHSVAEFDMTHYANVHCDGLPSVAVYREGDATLQPPGGSTPTTNGTCSFSRATFPWVLMPPRSSRRVSTGGSTILA